MALVELPLLVVKDLYSLSPIRNEERDARKKALGIDLFLWIADCQSTGLDPGEVITAHLNLLLEEHPPGKYPSLDFYR